jgi:hypothetical protein
LTVSGEYHCSLTNEESYFAVKIRIMPKWILVPIFIISITYASAQQVFVGLDQYTDYALQHNPSLQQSILSEKVERQNVNNAIAPLLPTANAQATINDNVLLPTTLIPNDFLPGGQPGTYRAVKFGTKYSISPSGSLNVNLVNASNYQNLFIAKKK